MSRNNQQGTKAEPQGSDQFSQIIEGRMDIRRTLHILRLTPKVLRLAWRNTPWHICLMMFLHVLVTMAPIAQLWLGKVLIDSIIAVTSQSPSSPGVPFVFMIVGAHGLLAVFSSILAQIQVNVQDYVGRRLSLYSDFLLRDKILELDLAMLENTEFHDQYRRASNGAGTKPMSLIDETMKLAGNIITLTSLGAIFLALKWPITVILIVTIIPNIYVMLKYSQKAYDVKRARVQASRWASYHASLLSNPVNFKEIKILQIGKRLLDRYKQFQWRAFYEDRTLLKKRQLSRFATGLLTTLSYYSAYVYIIYEAVNGRISIGSVAFYSGAFSRCQNAIKSVFGVIPNTHSINVYVNDFFELQKAKPEAVLTSGSKAIQRPVQSIEFRDVSLRYPRTNKWVLKHINLTFQGGERIGLVGENGAGKTSLIKLLCRLYDPTEGAIYVNGIDLREYDIEQWHRAIGVIFQDYVTYYTRVRDNIGYGQEDEIDNLPLIMEAARKGQADSFIQELPEKYETVLGRKFLKGHQISGGQWQRLALARLFMRKADVFVLDEPTYALDPRSEYEIYETFNKHCDGKISILISHRFSTMRIAGRIIVLDREIIEEGTHERLMQLGGIYAELYDIQSKGMQRPGTEVSSL